MHGVTMKFIPTPVKPNVAKLHTYTHTHTHTTHTHTNPHTHTLQLYFLWLKNLWNCNLWWLLDLLFLSVEFHLLERNGELSQFLSLCKRQEWRAVWLGYTLFCDQKLLHCKGDGTSRMYMERYRNVAQYFEDYPPNGIPTNFRNTQSIPQFTLCTTDTKRPKLSQTTHLSISSLQIQIYLWQIFRDNDRSRQCLIGNISGRTCFLREIEFMRDYPPVEALHMVTI